MDTSIYLSSLIYTIYTDILKKGPIYYWISPNIHIVYTISKATPLKN